MDGGDLGGQRLLLILVNQASNGLVQVALGTARSAKEWLEVEYSVEHAPIRVSADYVASRGMTPEKLNDFLAPVPGEELVRAFAKKAVWCVPVLVSTPAPGIMLRESPFYGMALRGKDQLILLRPPSEQEQDMGRWSDPWQPDSDNDIEARDDEDESDAVVSTSDRWMMRGARRPGVTFTLSLSCTQLQRRQFINDLMNQGFPIYNAGLLDPNVSGIPGWVSLEPDAEHGQWTRLLGWLRAHPAMVEVLEQRHPSSR